MDAENIYEISLTHGFGPIKFGAAPSEVMAAWGQPLCYEEWMGGNLENFLYFKGLLVGFRGEIAEQPTEASQVCMFHLKTVWRLQLWGQEITHATRDELAALLQQHQLEFRLIANSILQCTTRELQFKFNEVGVLDEVYFAKANTQE
ncbi:hypothetical protein L9G74_05065 [Shewanella sp. C32]|uniref:Uncharacterized protein n=1 Tax=Shewanella electrica TaxID=515560 RepID=A0ABT2FIJ3_9GAMM|nr:hypothetical protein [Shewanella electrica]MCH1923897.1 hypothetical protein [Shewanella electrica]MCS4555801.1 hypothetical protein [Shewanella electrica]